MPPVLTGAATRFSRIWLVGMAVAPSAKALRRAALTFMVTGGSGCWRPKDSVWRRLVQNVEAIAEMDCVLENLDAEGGEASLYIPSSSPSELTARFMQPSSYTTSLGDYQEF